MPHDLATAIVATVESVDELRHQGLSDRDVEAIGAALGVGARAGWRPRVSAEEFERLPFYSKPSYDQDVWEALGADWSRQVTARQPRLDAPIDLAKTFVHLGLGATAIPQEPFTGMGWYERYGARTATDGAICRANRSGASPWSTCRSK